MPPDPSWSRLVARFWLFPLLILQTLTHLFWLSPSAHSGQVAIPWMMNQGKTLFADIWEQHAPGSSLLGAAAQSLVAIDPALLVKLLNTLLVLVLTLLIYQLAKQLSGKTAAGILAALVWAWWEPVYGNVMLYFDTLLALCVLCALLIYSHRRTGPSSRQLIALGLCLGLATLFKQQAWLAVLLMCLWLLLRERKWQSWLLFVAAALALPLLQWVLLWQQGLLNSYIDWNWAFNLSGAMDGVPLDGDLFRKLLLSNLLVFPFALLARQGEDKRQWLLLLMWLATLTLLYPRFGEIHAMAHLPFSAVMSGIVLAQLLPLLRNFRAGDMPATILAGLLVGIGIGWLWTGAVTYIPTELGPGRILAYDEFRDLAAELKARKQTGDTLFLLPQTDSTPQLHPMTDMLPPGSWVKGWRWYFQPPEVLPTLTREWEAKPPDWVVVFPQLTESGAPGILALLEIVDQRYSLVLETGAIFGHGPAEIYQLKSPSE